MRLTFVAKPLGSRWGIYDTTLGSWPIQRPGLDPIAQDLPDRAAAEREADRLNQLLAGAQR